MIGVMHGCQRAALVASVAVLLGSAALLTGCRGSSAAVESIGRGMLVHERCALSIDRDARCVRLGALENRVTGRGRTIALRIVVLPAAGPDRQPDPVFVLAGGPGQAATELLGDQALTAGALRRQRDIVFVDQRGTGGSHPLVCGFYGPPDDAQTYFREFMPLEAVRACRRDLERVADLTQYTTAASVADLDEVREALGYETINLVGGSYGTRLAMEFARRHPGRVRSVVLEGPVPPSVRMPGRFGTYAQRSLDAVLDGCLATPACAEAFPNVQAEAVTVFDRLRQGPVTATVVHPAGRKATRVTLTRDHVAEALRYMLYTSGGALRVPLVLHAAFEGDFGPIARFLVQRRADGTFEALYLSITCTEDVPFLPRDAEAVDEPTFLGDYRVRQQRAACAEWPRGGVPDTHGAPVVSRAPVLIISGTIDPATPPEFGDEIARTLTNSRHVRVPFGAHSPNGLVGLDCLDSIRAAFIELADTAALDVGCVGSISRPPFPTR